jgi:hypothetical protein
VLRGWTAFLFGVAVFSPFRPPGVLSLLVVGTAFALGLVLALTALSGPSAPTSVACWRCSRSSSASSPSLRMPTVGSLRSTPCCATASLASTFAAFCFVLAVALPGMGTAAAFGLAVTAALAVQGTIFLVRQRSRPQMHLTRR